MATVTKPIALDESLNTTEQTPRNVADVLAQELARIAGRQASDVNYDNTASGLTADNVQDAIDELKSDIPTVNDGTLTIQQNGDTKGTFTANQSGNSTVNIEIPTTDIQTAVDEFETYNGGLLSECKVSLTPNQDLHGYSEPWVGGAGKNKLPMTVSGIKSVNTDGTWTGNSYALNGVTWTILTDDGENVIGIDGHGTASSQSNFFMLKGNYTFPAGSYNANGVTGGGVSTYLIYINTPSTEILNGDHSITFDGSQSPNVLCVVRDGVNLNHEKFYPMIRLATESNPTFAPYSNICPISGHTQSEVDVSDGQTTQEQITVNLGGTYYSGTLDVVSGEFTVDSAFIASYNGETLPSTWISDRDVYAVGTTPTTGAEVCYKLATPLTIQLSPTMVKALVGENHLSAPLDGQEITESKYKQMFTFDDVIAYIQSLS